MVFLDVPWVPSTARGRGIAPNVRKPGIFVRARVLSARAGLRRSSLCPLRKISDNNLGRAPPLLSHLLFIVFSVSFHRAYVAWSYMKRRTVISVNTKKADFQHFSM